MFSLTGFASRLDRAAARADARASEFTRRANAVRTDARPLWHECQRLFDAATDARRAAQARGCTPPSEIARNEQAYADACAAYDAAYARYSDFVREADVELDRMAGRWSARAGRFRRRAAALRVAQGFQDYEGHFAEAFEVMDYDLAHWLAPLCAVHSEVEEGHGLDLTDTFIFRFADGSEALFYEDPYNDPYVDSVPAEDLA